MQKKLLTALLSMILFLSAAFVQADTERETPKQALAAIAQLFKTKDWTSIVQRRCADTEHAASEAQVAAMVADLAKTYDDEARLQATVGAYERALLAEPEMDDERTIAIFTSELGSVTLTRLSSGSWGLRL